jgi:mRNA-degrading endonuclease YafQ of YafQ-DinJ toxin-antitoxin module
MPKVEPGPRFEKAFLKVGARDPVRRRQILKAIELFIADAHHPSLNFEKLSGTPYGSIRASRGDRIILRQVDDDAFELVDVGGHDIYRRYG